VKLHAKGSDHSVTLPSTPRLFYSIKLPFEIETENKSRPSISTDRYDFRTAPSTLAGLGNKAMRSGDYRRLHETFVEIALQRPDSPDGARWLSIAQACLELERQPPVGARRPGRPSLTSPTNGGTSEAPAPRRSAGQDRSAVRNCSTEIQRADIVRLRTSI
jgi:hypothetical protein